MKHFRLAFTLPFFGLCLTACPIKMITPEQVDEQTWTKNITQGELFSPSFNFTMTRNVFDGEVLFDTTIVKNANGKIYITNSEASYETYYEINDDMTCYYYYQEDGAWFKEKENSLSQLLIEVLDATIIHNFEYQAFTYDKENKLYYCDNYDSANYTDDKDADSLTFDRVEFKFLNNTVQEFKCTYETATYHVLADNFGTTEVTLPNAQTVVYTNPFWNTRHKLTNVQVEQSIYKDFVLGELSNTYLYVVGDENSTEVQMVNFVSDHLVYIYYGSNEPYQTATKTFTAEFEKRQGFGSEYDQSSYNSEKYKVDIAVVDNDVFIDYSITEDKESGPTVVRATATLGDKEDITEMYEYVGEHEALKERLGNKLITFRNVHKISDSADNDIYTGGHIVFSFDTPNDFVELYLNNGKVLIGLVQITQFDGEHFQASFNGMLNISDGTTEYVPYTSLNAELRDSLFFIQVSMGVFTYEMVLVFSDTPAETIYYSVFENRYKVNEQTWNYYLSSSTSLLDGLITSYFRYYNGDLFEQYFIAYKDGTYKIRRLDTDTREERTFYYVHISNNNYYQYSCGDSGWQRTVVSLSESYFTEQFKLGFGYSYSSATYVDNHYKISNDMGNASISFEYNTLKEISRTLGTNDVEYITYQFNSDIEIELPPLD